MAERTASAYLPETCFGGEDVSPDDEAPGAPGSLVVTRVVPISSSDTARASGYERRMSAPAGGILTMPGLSITTMRLSSSGLFVLLIAPYIPCCSERACQMFTPASTCHHVLAGI